MGSGGIASPAMLVVPQVLVSSPTTAPVHLVAIRCRLQFVLEQDALVH